MPAQGRTTRSCTRSTSYSEAHVGFSRPKWTLLSSCMKPEPQGKNRLWSRTDLTHSLHLLFGDEASFPHLRSGAPDAHLEEQGP